jgi:hypothetical protein
MRGLGQTPRLVAVLIAAVSAVGYVHFVQTSHLDRKGLASLLIEHTGIKALKSKPVQSEVVDPLKSAFAALKASAKRDPADTGGFGEEWSGSKSSGDAATLLVEFLPTSSQAIVVRTQALAEYTNQKTLKAADTTVTARFTLPQVAGARGISYLTVKSSTTGATSSSSIVFQFDRAVAVVYLQTSSNGLGRADAEELATSEYALLERREPGFSIMATDRPVEATLIYALVTITLVALILTIPGLVRRRKIRRQKRQDERARYEYRARGAKSLRRRRPPSWAQRAR